MSVRQGEKKQMYNEYRCTGAKAIRSRLLRISRDRVGRRLTSLKMASTALWTHTVGCSE